MTKKKSSKPINPENIITMFDKERISNIIFNSFAATAINYVGQEISITFSNGNTVDNTSVQYNLPLIKLTESQIRTLLLRKQRLNK